MRQFAAAMVLLGLGACAAVGPDFEEPTVSWLEGWQTDLYGQLEDRENASETDMQFWWHLFDDPILNSLIEVAWRENPTLRITGLRILESRALLGIAESALYPQVQTASGGVAYVHNNTKGVENQNLAAYDASLNLAWELDFWGRFQRGIESADAAYFASITAQQDAMVLLSAQVADLYFAYRTSLLRIGLAQRNATIQKRSFEITERLYKGGQSSELDLQQARTQYLGTLSTIPSLQQQSIQTRNALTALLGRAPGDVPELDGIEGDLPSVSPLSIDAVPAKLITRRPDVRNAAWLAAAQSAQIGLAEAEFYPSIA